MHKSLKAGVMLGALVAFSMGVQAAPVVDQTVQSVSAGWAHCYLGLGSLCGQSFTAGAADLAGAGFYTGGGVDGVTVSIYSDYSTVPSGLVARGVAPQTGWVDSQWLDVFWQPVAVTPGQKYYMVVDSVWPFLTWEAAQAANYAGGNALYGGFLDVYAATDLMFRTWSTTGAAHLPEPGSLALLGVGCIGLGMMRRRSANPLPV